MKTFTFLIAIMIFTATNIFAQNAPPIEPGVSQALAKWRGKHYSDVRYKLNITLEKGAPLMKGEIEIRVKLTEEGAKNPLVLDWRTTQFQNDKDKPFANVVGVNDAMDFRSQINNEHILIPNGLLKTGENVITIQFASPIKTSGAAITRYVDKEDNAEYIYSLFVPSDSSTAFPVFDQPDLKARFSLNVIVPKEWRVISNNIARFYLGELINDPFFGKDSPYKGKVLKAQNVFDFSETKPISTYVFAFAAGEFAEFDKDLNCDTQGNCINKKPLKDFGKAIQEKFNQKQIEDKGSKIYVRKSQAEKFKQHSAEVFRLNREGVKYLESYFDYKFPFPKYDLVLLPEFPFGGMEHAGATFLRESSVIFPNEPTKNDFVSRANLIFHEAAHQWFGDTVTMKWFDDLWLKEGFAEFMAYKTLAQVMPEYNAWKIFYERNKQLAYLTDSTKGTTPIYQEITNLSSAKSAYGNIVYRKAPSFLKQAEFYLGDNKFQEAVRNFLKKYEFKNAEWKDLIKEFEEVACSGNYSSTYTQGVNDKRIQEVKCLDTNKEKRDLSEWANNWVMNRGLPIIRVDFSPSPIITGPLGVPQKTFFVSQKSAIGEKNGLTQNFEVCIVDGEAGTTLSASIKSGDKLAKILLQQVSVGEKTIDTPDMIFPNCRDYGYGIFLLNRQSRAYVLKNIQNEKNDFLRTMMWGALWDSVREGELAPKTYVELVIKNINTETDESTIQTLLNRVGVAMNYYLSEPSAVAGGLTQTSQTSDKSTVVTAKVKPSATADGSDIARRLETLLIEKMQKSETLGQRITFYRAFLNIASSENERQKLKEILNLKFQISNFKLKTKDKFDIVTKLLILGDKDAVNLLTELEKTETSDEAKRYAYAARAGIGTAENKLKFWNDFVANKDISESWIESAFVSFNSPRHSDLTLPYLEKALAELPNLKRNRKIFFVNGWLASFIGGQKSEEALKIVNKFLADNPNLDKDLRLKILENVDLIERAVKIRGK